MFFNFAHKRPTFALTPESVYTLGFAQRIAHSGSQGETRAFQMGALLLPSDCFAQFGNPAWPGFRTANFAAFGLDQVYPALWAWNRIHYISAFFAEEYFTPTFRRTYEVVYAIPLRMR